MRYRHSSQRVFGAERLDPRLRHGLVGHWLGSGSGRALVDRTGRGNHAAFQTGAPEWHEGRFPGTDGLRFARSGTDFLSCGATSVLALQGAFSAAFWLRLRGDYTSAQGIISCGGSAADVNKINYFVEFGFTDNKLSLWHSGAGPAVSSVRSIADDNWHHYVVTRAGTTGAWAISIYIDGALDQAGSTAANPSGLATDYTGIGGLGWYVAGSHAGYGGYHLSGTLHDVRVYARAISGSEAALLAGPLPLVLPAGRRRIFYQPPPIIVTPDPSDVALDVVAPTVTLGSVTVTPTPSDVVLDTVAPSVGFSSVTVTPAASDVRLDTVEPTIPLNYSGWLALDAASCIVLAEAQPAEILRGWTATSGRPNTYEVAWSPFAQAALVGGGGVYRRLDSVEVDGVDLTERASIALVDGNLGSWYFDEAAELLYVSIDPAADPDSGADVVLAEFTIFLATDAKDFEGGELYEPKLTGALPTVRAESDDPLFGVKTYPGGTFEVANADGFFDALTRDWVWRNRPVTFYLGGSTMPRADYAAVATVVIEDMAPNDRVCRFRVRAAASALDQQLPFNVYDSTVGALLGEGVSGTYRPLLYGAVADIPAPMVDSTDGAQVYEVADPTLQVLTAVTAVTAIANSDGARTTLTLATDYTVDLAGCRVTIVNATYTDGSYEIRIDATGETDGAGGYLSTGGEILRDLLGVLGVSSASIETADFSTADTDAPYPLGLWIRERKAAAQYVRLVEASNLASLFVDSDGMWRYRIWEPTGDSTGLAALADEDFAAWDPDARIESLFAEVHARYAPNPATNAAPIAKAGPNPVVVHAYRERGVLKLDTVLLSASHAEVIAQRSLLIAGSPSLEVRVRERGLSSMTLNVRDRVSVTRARGPVAGGALEGVVMDVLEVEKTLGPPSVSLRLGDLWGLTARIGTIVGPSAPDWATATDAERNVSGFITDANGLADSGDPTSADHSIFW